MVWMIFFAARKDPGLTETQRMFVCGFFATPFCLKKYAQLKLDPFPLFFGENVWNLNLEGHVWIGWENLMTFPHYLYKLQIALKLIQST